MATSKQKRNFHYSYGSHIAWEYYMDIFLIPCIFENYLFPWKLVNVQAHRENCCCQKNLNYQYFHVAHYYLHYSRSYFEEIEEFLVTLSGKHKLYGRRVRTSRPEVFCKKGVLRNLAKFKRKHLCQDLFFNKVAGLKLEQLY